MQVDVCYAALGEIFLWDPVSHIQMALDLGLFLLRKSSEQTPSRRSWLDLPPAPPPREREELPEEEGISQTGFLCRQFLNFLLHPPRWTHIIVLSHQHWTHLEFNKTIGLGASSMTSGDQPWRIHDLFRDGPNLQILTSFGDRSRGIQHE